MILAYVWRTHQKVLYAKLWGIGACLAAMGSLLVGARGPGAPWFLVLTSNALLMPGIMLIKFGVVLAAGKTLPWRYGSAVCATFLGAIAWFLLVQPNLSARVAVFSAAAVALDLVALWACFTSADKSLANTFRVIGILLAVHDVSLIWRGTGALRAPLGSIFSPELFQVQFYLISSLITSALTSLFILLTSEKFKQELFSLSRHDALTGASNRLALEEIAAKEWSRALRHRHPVACLMLDLDNFKAFNDTHGHLAGDAALQRVSACAQSLLRHEDTWSRYGGEEFVALLPETGLKQASAIAERIRLAVGDLRVPCKDGLARLSISVGVAGCTPPEMDWEHLVALADSMLYRAKQTGRNKVVVIDQEPQVPA
ncbi:hypothetical protein JCM15519_28730 [Fundidesulfovibrio butyratiphilus]